MLNAQCLRSFRALCETGGFTRAADQLGLTQAAVSQHIARLEAELGPLLVRRPRQFELTPAGEALRGYCDELDAADQRLQCRLHDRAAEVGEIAITTPGSIGLAVYPLLLDWQAQRPGLVIRHRFAPDDDVIEAVLAQRYEVGLVARRPDDDRLLAEPFAEEVLELVVPAGAPACTWDDLAALGYIDHPDGQAMAGRLLPRLLPGCPSVRALPQHGFINQVGLILEPVARGLGFAVLPRHARRAFARQDEIRVVDCGPPVIDTLYLLRRAEWPLTERTRAAMDWLKLRLDVTA
ncbi:LysR family transcriptional regulator [Derxia gummosa]|uniref:LysR family transcriptional regulator n=1 Tax=Derxia gummosa DSM 723 TaxID=1121388 RepID=A0A8B6X8H9_9BURK|nr:LysR family transcriptional regulator [Derxia gummosa]